MSPSLNLVLPLLAFVQVSRCNPVTLAQVSELPPGISTTPTFSTENGIGLNKHVYPQLSVFTKSHPLPVILSSQGIAGLVGGSNQLLQIAGDGIISRIPIEGSASVPQQSTFTSTSEGALDATSLQSGVKNSVWQINREYTSPTPSSIQANNNELIGSILPYTSPSFIQNPNLIASYIQSSMRPGFPLSTVNKNVVSGFPTSDQITSIAYLPSSSTSAYYTLGNKNTGIYTTLSGQKFGLMETILNKPTGLGVSSAENPSNNGELSLQTPGTQTQIVQLPCTLHLPSPLAITVNPGVSQISTSLPIQEVAIPSSFIDHSPPTIAILRPPNFESVMEPVNVSAAASIPFSSPLIGQTANINAVFAPKVAESLLATTIREQTKQRIRSQDTSGVPVQNNEPSSQPETELESTQRLARNGLPIMYTWLPPQLSLSSPPFVSGAAPAVEGISNVKSNSSPTSRPPTRGTNPFFNVNKRKHFEYYQYF